MLPRVELRFQILPTPTASVGGEAVKVWLLRGHAPVDDAMLSVVVAKTTIMIGQGIFLLVGIMAASLIVAPGSPLLGWMVWLLAVEVILIGAFVAAQLRGAFGWGRGLLLRAGVGAPSGADTLLRVDRGLAWFYRKEPRRLALSIGCHFVAWLLGSLEAWLMLHFLGIEASLTTATVIEAFGTAIRFATFLVPASLGALEGGYVGTFAALGLSSSAGVAFGLTRRLREIVWIAAGFVAFARLRPGRNTNAAV